MCLWKADVILKIPAYKSCLALATAGKTGRAARSFPGPIASGGAVGQAGRVFHVKIVAEGSALLYQNAGTRWGRSETRGHTPFVAQMSRGTVMALCQL